MNSGLFNWGGINEAGPQKVDCDSREKAGSCFCLFRDFADERRGSGRGNGGLEDWWLVLILSLAAFWRR